jgi:hypothetical protein
MRLSGVGGGSQQTSTLMQLEHQLIDEEISSLLTGCMPALAFLALDLGSCLETPQRI